jgi:hypothetical protein
MFGALKREASHRTFDLVMDEFKAPRRAPRRFREYFFCLDSVRHFQLQFILARRVELKREAARSAKLRVNS